MHELAACTELPASHLRLFKSRWRLLDVVCGCSGCEPQHAWRVPPPAQLGASPHSATPFHLAPCPLNFVCHSAKQHRLGKPRTLSPDPRTAQLSEGAQRALEPVREAALCDGAGRIQRRRCRALGLVADVPACMYGRGRAARARSASSGVFTHTQSEPPTQLTHSVAALTSSVATLAGRVRRAALKPARATPAMRAKGEVKCSRSTYGSAHAPWAPRPCYLRAAARLAP